MAKQIQLDKTASPAKKGAKIINLLETGSIEEAFAATERWKYDSSNAIDDLGLHEAMHFSEELEAGRSRVFSVEESRCAWEKINEDIANLESSIRERITT